MNKQEFLSGLQARLSGLPQAEIEDRLAFYSEMIDDRMEDGLSEEEAVSAAGTVDDIAARIIADIPFSKIVKEKIKSKKKPGAIIMTLLILGSPIWISLAVAAFAVILSVYVSLWSVIISLWAVFSSLAVCGLTLTVAGIGFLIFVSAPTGLAVIGIGTVCAGLSILMFFGCKSATKYTMLLTKRIAVQTKKFFIDKEKSK